MVNSAVNEKKENAQSQELDKRIEIFVETAILGCQPPDNAFTVMPRECTHIPSSPRKSWTNAIVSAKEMPQLLESLTMLDGNCESQT